jgi:hypothetical protein
VRNLVFATVNDPANRRGKSFGLELNPITTIYARGKQGWTCFAFIGDWVSIKTLFGLSLSC